MEKKNKKPLKLSPKEFIWYILAFAFVIAGLTQIVLGLILEFVNVKVSDFPLYNGNEALMGWSKLGFLHWGLIWLAAGVVLGVIILCVFASSADREVEKTSRRAARLAKVHEHETVEAEVKDSPKAE